MLLLHVRPLRPSAFIRPMHSSFSALPFRPVLFGLALLWAAAGVRGDESFTQAGVFSGGSRTNGSAVITLGDVSTHYYTAGDFSINGSTTLTDLPVTSLFGGTNNLAGVYDYGFGAADFYNTPAGNGQAMGFTLLPISGTPQVTVAGSLTAGSTTQNTGASMTWNWKLVQFDGGSTYTSLASGTFTQTAIGGSATSLAGTTTIPSTSVVGSFTSGWVGFFVQGSNATNASGGSHFNVGLDLEFTAAAVPEPSAYAVLAGALAGGVAVWRRKSARQS